MTTTHSTTNDLLFLLAAAPLGLGCIIVSDDTDDTAGETATPQTTGQTTGADTSDPATGTGTDTAPATSNVDTGDSGDSGTSGGTGIDSTGADSTGATADACTDYATQAIACDLPYSRFAEYNCNYQWMYLDAYSADCGAGYEDLLACLTALPCEELMGVDPCPDQLAALLALGCPTIE